MTNNTKKTLNLQSVVEEGSLTTKNNLFATSISKEPRLMIKKMILTNFKSYYGTHEIGPFHKRFTTVIGPNGSGKSNVIDGMLFVFGKKAKQIRQKKLSELIHRSKKYPNLDRAEVSVFFHEIIDEDDDTYRVVPNSEFSVKRSIKRKGASQYYINNKKSTTKGVTLLLKSKGIDLDYNRFLILQGEVEQISLMKPKSLSEHEIGLLEYIEDIVGSGKYIPLIQEASEKVEALNESRNVQVNRVKMIEKDKDNLEGSKNEAVAYLKQKKELSEKSALRFNFYKKESEKNIETVTEKKEDLEEKLQKERESVSERLEELEVTEQKYKSEEKALQEIQKEVMQYRDDLKRLEEKDVKIRETMKHRKRSVKSQQKTLEKEENNRAKYQDQITKCEDTIKDCEGKNVTLDEQLKIEEEKAEKLFEAFKENTADIHVELERKQKEIIPFNEKVSEWESKLNVTNTELGILNKESQSIKDSYQETKEKITSLQQIISDSEKKFLKNKKQIKEKAIEIEKLEESNQQISVDEKKLIQRKRDLQMKIEKAKNSRNAMRSQSKLLKRLMKEKERGNIRGVNGRLGDLGTIDPKYDVAISTACGALNNIVVETTRDGNKSIELLQRENLGRATFIILDKIEHLRKNMQRNINTPENVPRLFDLVRPNEEKFQIAFYYGVRDTLVAKDLEQATRIAYGTKKIKRRFRVVTLQGEVIDLSGTISGGGGRSGRRGGMQTSTNVMSREELDENIEQLEIVERELRDLIELKRQQEHILNDLKKELQTLQFHNRTLEMDISTNQNQEKELSEHLPILEKQIKKNKKNEERKQQLKIDISTFEKKIKSSKQDREQLNTEIENLQAKIMESGGKDLQDQKQKVVDINDQINQNNTDMNKNKAKIKSLNRQIDNSKKKSDFSQKSLEKIQKEFEELENQKTENQNEAEKIMEHIQQFLKVKNEKEDSLKEIEKQYKELKKLVSVFRNKEVDISEQIEEYKKFIKQNKDYIRQYNLKLKKLSEQFERGIKLNKDEKLKIDYLQEELEEFNLSNIEYDITLLEENLKRVTPNMSAIEEYRRKENDFNEKLEQLDKITEERDLMRNRYEEYRKKRLNEFMNGFSEITMKLKEIYQMITLGGDAELELVDSLDPFSEGIIFSVRPPNKSWKNISNLSGGEKTLSSLALVFALHHYKPTPVYFMDEIDAALDFRNVSIIANYIRERTKNAQFVIISLRNNMFELANRLIGIYKTDNCTKSVAINPKSFVSKKLLEKNKNTKN
ncbi:structural maintenance of chromosomes protein [Anaeramoeba flamelloides]|uniref:Structural maintenance of chromosomes protein n=1 Tax=Anaeramoeba flamelloides TaxID=1746091 RepID=A0ABQ8YMT4_9EUKA|nr:structural maintenance of chromosomes protein [Anaeramoeba flamelloides]